MGFCGFWKTFLDRGDDGARGFGVRDWGTQQDCKLVIANFKLQIGQQGNTGVGVWEPGTGGGLIFHIIFYATPFACDANLG